MFIAKEHMRRVRSAAERVWRNQGRGDGTGHGEDRTLGRHHADTAVQHSGDIEKALGEVDHTFRPISPTISLYK